jgi:hypothetical protein
LLQGANRPSARNVTLSLLNKPYFKATTQTNGSTLAAALGQLVCEYCAGQHLGSTLAVANRLGDYHSTDNAGQH